MRDDTRAALEAFVRDEEAVRRAIEQFTRELRHADERGTRVWHNGSADSNAYCWCWFGERLLALLDDREAKLAAVRHGLREAQRVIRACVDREECRENPDADDWRSLRKRARATLQVQP